MPPAPEAGAGGEGVFEAAVKRRSGRRPARRAGRCRRPRSRSDRRASHEDEGGESEDREFQPHHALNVPREADLRVSTAPGVEEPVTTIMLRHIPCRYTQGTLLRELDQLGFEGRYDFFYLPMDVRNKTSVGYAFVNFEDPGTAAEFSGMMQDYRFQRHPNDKVAEASPAHLQGLRRNVAHFSSRTVLRARDSKYRPIVLQKGFKRDFAELLAELATEEQPPQPAGAAREAAPPAAPSAGLNPMAHDFVPGAAAFGQKVPEDAGRKDPTPDPHPAGLNPLAQEFVPCPPPGLAAPPPLIEALATPPVLPAGPPAEAPRPMPPRLGEARRGLEEAISGLLQKRQEVDIAKGATGVDEELPAREQLAEPEAEPPTGRCQPPRKVPPALESVEAAAPCKGTRTGEGSWVEEAFGALVQDLVPGRADAGSWITEAFVALIDDEPPTLGQSGGGWVAEAFGKLVGRAPAPRPRRLLGALLSPAPAELGGGWIAEAFSALGRGCRTPSAARMMSSSWAGSGDAVEQQLGWVAEALRALTACRPPKDPSMPASAPGTPRESLQRLRAMGGWAWVAFA
mmetsp:Transcript_7439/g.20913  ORF Transcript_7439/g.20913 Transcript_7439/m.20913 type:complete len:570 (+) Transcript_7439:67-1776(+)